MFVDFNILNQLGSPSINSNTFANRPAAGQTGRLFVSTDTFEIYRDNGTGWDLIGGPGSSTVTGSGAAGQVTYWTGTNTVSGENALFWDAANNRLGINTATPTAPLDVHSAADVAMQLNGTGGTPTVLQQFLSAGVAQYELGYNWNASADYRRFSIYDTAGAKEVISIDQQSRRVGINFQYTSLADQPQYTFDVDGDIRGQRLYVLSNAETTLISNTKPVGGIGQNVFFGNGGDNVAFTSGDTGSYNTGIGWGALQSLTTGFYNVAIGQSAMAQSTTSSYTTAVGDNAGRFDALNNTVNNLTECLYIGRIARASANNVTNEIAIGNNAIGQGNNTIQLGNTSVSLVNTSGAITSGGAITGTRFIPTGSTIATNGMYLPTTNTLAFSTSSVERVRIDAIGNVGLSVTPSAWDTYIGLQIAQQGSISSTSTVFNIGTNLFYGASGYTYIANGFATLYQQNVGGHNWRTAASGIAGNPITWNQAMTLVDNGNLLIGTTTDNGSKLRVAGNSYIDGKADIGLVDILSSATSSAVTASCRVRTAVEMRGYEITMTALTPTSGSITIPNMYAFRTNVPNVQLSVTVTNSYGLYVSRTDDPVSGGVVTNKYGIIVEDTAGPVGIGVAAPVEKLEVNGAIKTAAPTTGTAAAWKFGSRVAAVVALDATQYIELDVAGTLYKLAIVT